MTHLVAQQKKKGDTMETWLERYNGREQLQIAACRSYAANFSGASLPGHNLMLLVAALPTQLGEAHRLLNGMPPDAAPPDDPDYMSVLVPVPVPVPARPLSTEAPATERQITTLYAVARAARGWHPGRLDEECGRLFGVPPEDLTIRQASRLIDHLKVGLGVDG
jgi:hypothetical protein